MFPKNRGKTPKMDGENNGKTLSLWIQVAALNVRETMLVPRFVGISFDRIFVT